MCVCVCCQGGDVIRLRHAEVEGQLAAFLPSSKGGVTLGCVCAWLCACVRVPPPCNSTLLTDCSPAISPTSSGLRSLGRHPLTPSIATPGGVALLLNAEEEDAFGSSLSLWEVRVRRLACVFTFQITMYSCIALFVNCGALYYTPLSCCTLQIELESSMKGGPLEWRLQGDQAVSCDLRLRHLGTGMYLAAVGSDDRREFPHALVTLTPVAQRYVAV